MPADAHSQRVSGRPAGVAHKLKVGLVGSGLTHLHRAAAKRPLTMNFDAGKDKLVCVSDLHRGKRDGADDFRRSERVYNAALAWYHRSGYHLAVLGDAEDLWECKPDEVLDCTDGCAIDGYARSLALEKRFNDDGKYLRVYGNHDRIWSAPKAVKTFLRPHFGDPSRGEGRPLDVRGAVLITVEGKAAHGDRRVRPQILLTHGDAGTLDSAVLAPISKHGVHFWTFWQKKIGAFTGVPADNWELRENQDQVMYQWAERQRLLLITGHTHRPVFASRWTHPDIDTAAIKAAEAELDAQRATLSAEALAAGEFEVAEMRRQASLRSSVRQTRPCYFNTGACCFGDGDITAIEISDDEIRLVRWAWHPDDNQVVGHANERDSLHDVFARIQAYAESAAWIRTRQLDHVTVTHDPVPAPDGAQDDTRTEPLTTTRARRVTQPPGLGSR